MGEHRRDSADCDARARMRAARCSFEGQDTIQQGRMGRVWYRGDTHIPSLHPVGACVFQANGGRRRFQRL